MDWKGASPFHPLEAREDSRGWRAALHSRRRVPLGTSRARGPARRRAECHQGPRPDSPSMSAGLMITGNPQDGNDRPLAGRSLRIEVDGRRTGNCELSPPTEGPFGNGSWAVQAPTGPRSRPKRPSRPVCIKSGGPSGR